MLVHEREEAGRAGPREGERADEGAGEEAREGAREIEGGSERNRGREGILGAWASARLSLRRRQAPER